jgi:tetratricopeptide (TPR) repeat protein
MLRLGELAQKAGKYQEASDFYKDALGQESENADAWIMLANLDLEKRAFRSARGSFERVLKKIDARDTYSLLALGNDRLLHARTEATPESKANMYKEAARFFDKVLRIDSKNAYGALGLAIAVCISRHNS